MTEDAFDAEGQLTSAVNYVTSDADRTVYTVTGHGEEDLSSVITDAIDKANLNLDSVSPILNGSIPEDCDLLIVNGPATDLSADELTILQDYLTGGGQMIFLAGDTLDALPNWEALLESRGFDLVDGYIADLGSYYPQFGSAFAICGVLNTGSGVASGVDSDALTLLTNSRGFLSWRTRRRPPGPSPPSCPPLTRPWRSPRTTPRPPAPICWGRCPKGTTADA